MEDGLTAAGLEQLLASTREVLERMHGRGTAAGRGDTADGQGGTNDDAATATARDATGRATATVGMPGRVRALELDPRLLRGGTEAVCAAVTEAVNAALADLQERALRDAGRAGGVDLDELAEAVEQVQSQAMRNASELLSSLRVTVDRLERQSPR